MLKDAIAQSHLLMSVVLVHHRRYVTSPSAQHSADGWGGNHGAPLPCFALGRQAGRQARRIPEVSRSPLSRISDQLLPL